METTLEHIYKKYNVTPTSRLIRLPIAREGLGELFAELGFTRGAEIGVDKGYFSSVLLKANPKLRMWCIDAWTAYEGYRDYVNQDRISRHYAEAKKGLAKYNAHIIKDFSMNVVKTFRDNSLDFVYLDGNHDFQNVINDIAEWGKKVRVGGILAGHDYTGTRKSFECRVKYAVDAWAYAYNIRPYFMTTDPSWLWVKT